MGEAWNSAAAPAKDPRAVARKYQLDMCKRALEENIIVYLGTGCGKTHISVLLMHELSHLISKPAQQVCVFLAPTVPLVRQQALVIETSANFKVKCYHGSGKNLKDSDSWAKELQEYEVLVMTPQILLHNLRHCFIKMDSIALLVFDECHHAQAHKRHPYAQIMKEFYKVNGVKSPRIFGMTASPVVGKGGVKELSYTKCINSLEHLLDAKVCYLEDNTELEAVVASPDMEVFLYGPVNTSFMQTYSGILMEILSLSLSKLGNDFGSEDYRKKQNFLWRLHENLNFCLQHIGLSGVFYAAKILLSSNGDDLAEMVESTSVGSCTIMPYLNNLLSSLNDVVSDVSTLESLEEPFFSKKLAMLIEVLLKYREEEEIKCIIFVKRIMIARLLAYIFQNLKCLSFWKCAFLIGCHSGLRSMSRKNLDAIVGKFCSGEVTLLVATSVAEEGLDIQTCSLVVRFDLPETINSFIQSRGRARKLKSKYVFLLERGNRKEEDLLSSFISGETMMNKEISDRTSDEICDSLLEAIYRVDSTGATISTGCSISLLYRYCNCLPRDKFFTPSPRFFYKEGVDGIVCTVVLPPNAALRQANSLPRPSKNEAKRYACLDACIKLYELHSLTHFLLPVKIDLTTGNSATNKPDQELREELHKTASPSILKMSLEKLDAASSLHLYYLSFIPIPDDRQYRMFGMFVVDQLPQEAEELEFDLHLAHGRIVRVNIEYSGAIPFDKEQMTLAQNFHEMCLKVLFDRLELSLNHVMLGQHDPLDVVSSTYYLLLPLKRQNYRDSLSVDWLTIRCCLSSPVFKCVEKSILGDAHEMSDNSLILLDGPVSKHEVLHSLVYTPYNKLFFFVDGVLDGTNARSPYKDKDYIHYYQRFGVQLSHPEQPLLKAKHLFNLHNLLHNRIQEMTEARDLAEHFVEIPPELCQLKIIGFSKDIGSSLSLIPSLMHRVENLLMAIELKNLMASHFPEASQVRAYSILRALTMEKCSERFSLERFEVLGDAFLKYVVSRHSFLLFESLDEGQLTRRRCSTVNNLNLYELALKKNLQVYIRQPHDPGQFFAFGRFCKVACDPEKELSIHQRKNGNGNASSEKIDLRCKKSHQWLHGKAIADVVEALLGALLVDSGFRAACAFLRWLGIHVDFEASDVHRACHASNNNLSLLSSVDVSQIERLIGHEFKHKGLILQALTHPSFYKHSGSCYQKLEFLGDAVLEYLITSYLYSMYPDLKPGQITDLKSAVVNNNSFAYVAVLQSLHKHMVKDSENLSAAVREYASFVTMSDGEKELLEEPACPKVLGDIVESCIGAVLLDTGFNLLLVWKLVLQILAPRLNFSCLFMHSVRELLELCQSYSFDLSFPKPMKVDGGDFLVAVEVNANGNVLQCTTTCSNTKTALKIVAKEMLSKLKALGYKHKRKTLEDVLRTTQRKEPELIGFDEEPIQMELETSLLDFNAASADNAISMLGNADEEPYGSYCPDAGLQKTAKARLIEICAAFRWEAPRYELVEECGPCHLKKFMYKVTVEIRSGTPTFLECFGDPKLQKKAAKEHAAEGAVWYMRQCGFIP